jgi:hypothetical protein
LGAATTQALARIRQDQGDNEGAATTAEDSDEDIEAATERARRLSAEVTDTDKFDTAHLAHQVMLCIHEQGYQDLVVPR